MMPEVAGAGTGPTVVLGVGNPLMGDDGLGLAALERLREGWNVGPGVQLVDGGTWGMSLLPIIESAGKLLVLDAVRHGQAPGTLAVLEAEAIPRFLDTKLSPHQIDLREVLALAELRGTTPGRVLILGAEPASVEMRCGLSTPVSAILDSLVELAVEQLRAWGDEVHALAPLEACAT